MILLTAILTIVFVLSFWQGYRQVFRLEYLNQRLLINSFLAVMGILTLMTVAHWFGVFTQQAAAHLTMGIYTLAAGFFSGYGSKLLTIRKKADSVEYMYRSFWTDIAPNLIAILVVAFGVYRSGIIRWGPFTGIGITSGISLVAFGFWGWTIRVVPEFRSKGLLFLDQYIPWQQLVSYQWISEETIEIDYLNRNDTLTSFRTFIPSEDQLLIERLLNRKLQQSKEDEDAQIQQTY